MAPLLAGAPPVLADIAIVKAEISSGRLVVAGTRTGTAPRIVLDGRYDAEVAANGSFSFALIYLPADCIVRLEADGGTGGEELAVVANCAPRSLRPRGAWRNNVRYAANDLVTDDGTTYRARASNSGKRPPLSPANWEVFAARGERGPQGIQGATGYRGLDGAPGRDGAAPLLLHGEQHDIEIGSSFRFVGPAGEMTLAKDQFILIPSSSIALRMTNSPADTAAEITFCSQAEGEAELVPFARIAESFTLALPRGRAVDYAQDFALIAADPGHPGKYTVGACMRHNLPSATTIAVSSFAVWKTIVHTSR